MGNWGYNPTYGARVRTALKTSRALSALEALHMSYVEKALRAVLWLMGDVMVDEVQFSRSVMLYLSGVTGGEGKSTLGLQRMFNLLEESLRACCERENVLQRGC